MYSHADFDLRRDATATMERSKAMSLVSDPTRKCVRK